MGRFDPKTEDKLIEATHEFRKELKKTEPIRDESIGGWNKIPFDAYNNCEGAKDKGIFYEYCVNGNCSQCPYNK